MAGLLLAAAAGAQAQSKATPRAAMPKPALLKDGAFRRNGQTMRLQAGQVSRLSVPLTLENGAVLRPDGIIVSRNGTRQLLADKHAVNLQGTVVLLRDDMFTAQAIDERAQAVTGSTGETRFTVPSAAGAADGTGVSPRLAAQLLRTEQRLTLLEDMTTRLERRTQSKSTTTAALDQQLKQVNAELRQSAAPPKTPAAAPAPAAPAPATPK